MIEDDKYETTVLKKGGIINDTYNEQDIKSDHDDNIFQLSFLDYVYQLQQEEGLDRETSFWTAYNSVFEHSNIWSESFENEWNGDFESYFTREDIIHMVIHSAGDPFQPLGNEWTENEFVDIFINDGQETPRSYKGYSFVPDLNFGYSGLHVSACALKGVIDSLELIDPWYHGTNIESAWHIAQNGISLNSNNGKKSFGSGYYLTNDFKFACKFADKASRWIGTQRYNHCDLHFDGGAILVYDKGHVDTRRCTNPSFYGDPYIFISTTKRMQEWESFVKYNYLGKKIEKRFERKLITPPSLIVGPTPLSGANFFKHKEGHTVLFEVSCAGGPVVQACVKDSMDEKDLWDDALRAVIIYNRR